MTTESQTGEEPTILWGGFEFFPKKVTTDTFGIPLDALEWRPNECRRRNLPEDDEMDTYFATREDRDIALSEKPK